MCNAGRLSYAGSKPNITIWTSTLIRVPTRKLKEVVPVSETGG
jgi:hypothetical protein